MSEKDPANSKKEELEISKLGQAVRALDSESPERQAYLEKLRSDIEAGRYKVDASELSKRLIKDITRRKP